MLQVSPQQPNSILHKGIFTLTHEISLTLLVIASWGDSSEKVKAYFLPFFKKKKIGTASFLVFLSSQKTNHQ